MSSGLNTARHGTAINASNVLEVSVNEELLRAALMNALERIDKLERKLLDREPTAKEQGVSTCPVCGRHSVGVCIDCERKGDLG